MILVYNEEGLNDTLLCIMNNEDKTQNCVTEQQTDFTIIKQNAKVIGINIKNAKIKFTTLPKGVNLNESFSGLDEVKQLLSEQLQEINYESELAQKFVIGHVIEKQKHPDSEKLSVCQVDVGDEVLQIVCGAENVAMNQKVIVAKVGCMMPTGLIIEPSKLRKVDSIGMICSGRELNLSEKYQTPGILELSEDAPIGKLFFDYFMDEMKV